ncbi:MAG: FMN-binding protein [Bacteroidales bacterium]|nr:FMN-binding protein [Bacteroidales bacterium]
MKAKMTPFHVIIMIIAVQMTYGCQKINSEHDEAMSLEIKDIDFTSLKEGTYNGYYAGGMQGWRENECMVTVNAISNDSGKVTEIKLIRSVEDREQSFFDELYRRVIEKQSLQVDVISGATLTSKAHLKSIEDALLKAER